MKQTYLCPVSVNVFEAEVVGFQQMQLSAHLVKQHPAQGFRLKQYNKL